MIDLQAILILTPRQAQVAQLLALGLSNDQIAEQFFILPDTVRTHTQHAYRRLGVHRLAELVEWAISAGLVTREESIRAREGRHV